MYGSIFRCYPCWWIGIIYSFYLSSSIARAPLEKKQFRQKKFLPSSCADVSEAPILRAPFSLPFHRIFPNIIFYAYIAAGQNPFPLLFLQENQQLVSICFSLLVLSLGRSKGQRKRREARWQHVGNEAKILFTKRNPCYQESSKWCGRMKYRTTTQTTVMTNASIGNQGSTQWAGNQRPGNRGSGVGLMMHRAQCETAFTKINQNFWHLRKLTLYWDEWALQLFSANRSKLRQHFCERTSVARICNNWNELFVCAHLRVIRSTAFCENTWKKV